jgi:hypothetical protein
MNTNSSVTIVGQAHHATGDSQVRLREHILGNMVYLEGISPTSLTSWGKLLFRARCIIKTFLSGLIVLHYQPA